MPNASAPMPDGQPNDASAEPAHASAAPQGNVDYLRARDLPRLIAIWPNELEETDLAGHGRIVAKIRRALREERKRGKAGHWTYDLARHALLLTAYRCELHHLSRRLSGRADRTI
ncbi:MAG: hypothetical protein ACK4MF_07160 [Hyphomicrobiaceae bacterium]